MKIKLRHPELGSRSYNRFRNNFGMSLLFFLLIFTACKAKDTTDNSGLQAAAAAKNNTVIESVETTADLNNEVSVRSSNYSTTADKIDLDLTKMSATMIYTTIFDMLVMPEDYVEKNIKLKGWFETYLDQTTNELYYAVIVPDATACCQQGIEFVWPGDHTYPADFPNPGEDITVTGIYKIIESNGISYNYIEASSVEF